MTGTSPSWSDGESRARKSLPCLERAAIIRREPVRRGARVGVTFVAWLAAGTSEFFTRRGHHARGDTNDDAWRVARSGERPSRVRGSPLGEREGDGNPKKRIYFGAGPATENECVYLKWIRGNRASSPWADGTAREHRGRDEKSFPQSLFLVHLIFFIPMRLHESDRKKCPP